jgi:hypothetical protein
MFTALRRSDPAAAAIDLVVLATVVVLLIGVSVPIVRHYTVAGDKTEALGDVRRIASDVLNFNRDTGTWPSHAVFAFSDGEQALSETHSFGSSDEATHLSRILVTNDPPVPNWRGPYMSLSRPDPWGHRYVVLLEGLQRPGTPYPWVISAGPDGVFQTTSDDRRLRGDDLGLLLR